MADNVKIDYSRRIHKKLQAFLFNLMGQTSYDKYFNKILCPPAPKAKRCKLYRVFHKKVPTYIKGHMREKKNPFNQ